MSHQIYILPSLVISAYSKPARIVLFSVRLSFRSAYIIYDLQDNMIGLAQTNLNSTGSNIMELPLDGTGLQYLGQETSASSIESTSYSLYTSTAFISATTGAISTGSATTDVIATGTKSSSVPTSHASLLISESSNLAFLYASGVFALLGSFQFFAKRFHIQLVNMQISYVKRVSFILSLVELFFKILKEADLNICTWSSLFLAETYSYGCFYSV